MFKIDNDSLSTALQNVKKVISDNEKNMNIHFDFQSFKIVNHPYFLGAIDGSNHNIRGTNFVLSTLRTGFLLYEKGILRESQIEPIKIEFIMNNQDPEVGFEYKHEKYFHGITGEIPQGKLEFEKVTERIRTLLEWQKVAILIENLSENDIIIFDGSFISGEISTSHIFYNELVEKAKRKGIALVGLSKDTSLSIDSSSLPILLLEASKEHYPGKNWFVKFNDTYFVRFSKRKDLIYRVDAVVPNHLTFEQVISWVGSYCFDTPTFGYPYPMQKIHDSVRISELEKEHCFNLFKTECLKSGIPHSTFEKMFAIYHDQLDIMSFGR